MYSSALTTSSPTYQRTGCYGSSYYYEAIEVKVVNSGYYTLRSNSTINTYGSIYNDTFNPFSPTVNLLLEDDGRCLGDQFKLTMVLQANTKYILVVTTYFSNVTGAFSIFVSGRNNVNFNHIGEYL